MKHFNKIIMKRLLLSLAILTSVSFTVSINAQDKMKGRPSKAGLRKELNLSAEQQQKFEQLNADFKTKTSELRANKDLTREATQTKMKELRQNHHDAISAILTPEQQSKLKEKRGNRSMAMKGNKPAPMHRQHHKKGGEYNRFAFNYSRMKDLNLTNDQKEQIAAINKDHRAKTKELSDQRKEALNKVYTPEQLSKLKETRNNGKFKGNNGHRRNLDDATKAKLQTLKENFVKEKKAVELSRIAPDAQKQKISDLQKKYKQDRLQIIKEVRKTQEKK